MDKKEDRMNYKKTLIIYAMVSAFVGLQIRYEPQSKELFAVSAQAEGNSDIYRLNVGVRIMEKSLINEREKVVEQIVRGIARNTLINMDFGYEEKGLPEELSLRIYYVNENEEYLLIFEKSYSKAETAEIYKKECNL